MEIRNVLADIFDLNPKTTTLTRNVNNVIYLVILLSTLVVTLETLVPIEYLLYLQNFETLVAVVFLIELLAKTLVINKLFSRHTKTWERSLIVFYYITDVVAVIPPIILLINQAAHHDYFLTLRLIRVFKAFQHDRSIELIIRAIIKKRTELVKSALVVFVSTIFLSVLLFEVENDFELGAKKSKFTDIFTAMTWSFAVFIDDATGHIDAGLQPLTSWGKVIAAIIGLLKIGIVVIPTGIIATGFMEVVEENRMQDQYKLLKNAFRKKYSDQLGVEVFERPRTLFTLKNALFIHENNMFAILENTKGFRIRAVQSDAGERYVDTNLIEHFAYQDLRAYGVRMNHPNAPFLFVCPNSYAEVGIGYFSYCLAEMFEADLVSNELYQKNSLHQLYDFDFQNNEMFWQNQPITPKERKKLSPKHHAFLEFKEDLLNYLSNKKIIVVETDQLNDDFELSHTTLKNAPNQLLTWLADKNPNTYLLKVNRAILENYTYYDQLIHAKEHLQVCLLK